MAGRAPDRRHHLAALPPVQVVSARARRRQQGRHRRLHVQGHQRLRLGGGQGGAGGRR